jgi:hypothetical protein
MKILLSKEAEFDLLEAEDWYNQQRANLGLELREAFDQKLDQISENATHFQLRYRSVRVTFFKQISLWHSLFSRSRNTLCSRLFSYEKKF